MAMYASWVHGNALTVESPENLERVGHFGWGADMVTKPGGQDSWFHIPLPTPVIVGEGRTTLKRVFLLFWSDGGRIREVHVWDGPIRLQVFNNVDSHGEHRFELDGRNTFPLARPSKVAWGVGISFLFENYVEFDDEGGFHRVRGHFILAAAGGDFFTEV